MSWIKVTLSEVCTTITDGAHSSPPSREDGYPMGSVKDMTDLGIDLSGCRKISADDYHKLCASGCKPYEGDVLIAKDGNSCLQTVCVHKRTIDMVLLSSVAILRPDPNKCDSRFLKYHFANPATKAALKNYVSGVAIPRVVLRDFKNYRFSIPSLEKQKQIGSFLSTYDDLIENNKRRIELLEESARQLYKEWFVRFRFPGHEHVKIIDGVPEEWTKGSVGDIASIFSGYAFKSKDWLDQGNPVIKIKNITEKNTVDISDCQCVDDNVAEKAIKFKLLAEDMLIAMTGATVGKVGLLPSSDRTFYLNQRVGKFVSKLERSATPLLLPFFNSEKAQASIANLAGGAAQPNISAKQIESIELPIPPKSILDTYLDEIDSSFELRSNLVDQNLRLTQARDLLLPKLMSGEIAV